MGTDTRDLRDPQKLGEALLGMRRAFGGPLTRLYDQGDWATIEPYTANPTTLEKYGRPQDLPQTTF